MTDHTVYGHTCVDCDQYNKVGDAVSSYTCPKCGTAGSNNCNCASLLAQQTIQDQMFADIFKAKSHQVSGKLLTAPSWRVRLKKWIIKRFR